MTPVTTASRKICLHSSTILCMSLYSKVLAPFVGVYTDIETCVFFCQNKLNTRRENGN